MGPTNLTPLKPQISATSTAKPAISDLKNKDKDIVLDQDLKDEAARQRQANYIVGGMTGAGVLGIGGLLGGTVAGGALFVFSGSAFLASVIATGGLSILGGVIVVGAIIAFHFHRKSKQQNVVANQQYPDAVINQQFPPSRPEKFIFTNEDKTAIYKALGVSKGNIDKSRSKFEKQHGRDISEVADAVGRVVGQVRFKKLTAVYGSLGVGGGISKNWKGKGKWKYLVILDPQTQKIKRLFVAKQVAQGSFTKVAISPTRTAMLIPKKCSMTGLEFSEKEQVQAQENIKYLHDYFEKSTKHPYKITKQVLPPLPKTIQSTKLDSKARPITLAPEATAAEIVFKKAPEQGDTKDIINRLKVLRDVAMGVDLMHEANMVHGDIKPANMLISQEPNGRAHPHDFGGARIIETGTPVAEAVKTLNTISWTPSYMHTNDINQVNAYSNGNPSSIKKTSDVMQLGQSLDVFALGVSTIKALNGMDKSAFQDDAYAGPHRTISGGPKSRMSINCIPSNSPTGRKLNALLDRALSADYQTRGSVNQYVQDLNEIIAMLEKTLV